MGYKIRNCTGEDAEMEDLSRFLAEFVADGEGPGGGEEALTETWRQRLRWWWEDNPFCEADSDRGCMLLSEEGEILGFFGFFPHDYVLDGRVIPSLISTTTFVRETARDGALGLIMRAHRIKEKYQLVDGGPNVAMQEMLNKLGYERVPPGKMHFFPIRRVSKNPLSLAMHALSFVNPGGTDSPMDGRVINSPEEIQEVPVPLDGKLRKRCTKESLQWLCASGSQPRAFVGYCDASGVLQCYVLGNLRRFKGIMGFQILDHSSFSAAGETMLSQLVAEAAMKPDSFGIPKEAILINWAVAQPLPGNSRLSIAYDARLNYRLPKAWQKMERLSVPYEGDKAFL